MNEAAVLAALLRSDLRFFIRKCFQTILPGTPYLPNQANWLDSLLLELLAFPNGRHDDQVDSVSQFLKWVAREMFYEQSLGLGLPVVPSAPVGECY